MNVMHVPQSLKQVVISASLSGANELVALVAGKKIAVYAWAFVAAGAVSITWKRGTTALSGAMPFGQFGAEVRDIRADGEPWYQTDVAEALNWTLSGAVLVAGTLYYREI